MIVNRNGTTFSVYYGDESPKYRNTVHKSFWQIADWGVDFYPTLQKASDVCHTFVDVGAWIGPFTLFCANHYKQVVSFEPDDMAFEELKANVELNGFKNVELNQVAVSNHNGVLQLGTDRNRNEGSHAGISFTYETFDVPCVTLDKLYKDRNLSTGTFLKIDIEGAEHNLFDDISFFEKNRPHMFLELHPIFLDEPKLNQLKAGVSQLSSIYNGVRNMADRIDYWMLTPK